MVASETGDSAVPTYVYAMVCTPASNPKPFGVPSKDVFSCVYVSIPQHTASVGASIAVFVVGAKDGGQSSGTFGKIGFFFRSHS